MFLRPNIDRRGRLARLGIGLLLAGGAVALGSGHASGWRGLASLGLAVASAFVLFEAAAGWCAARACGLRTRF